MTPRMTGGVAPAGSNRRRFRLLGKNVASVTSDVIVTAVCTFAGIELGVARGAPTPGAAAARPASNASKIVAQARERAALAAPIALARPSDSILIVTMRAIPKIRVSASLHWPGAMDSP